jgi:5-methylcytosine-specific restriction protein A
MPSAPPIACPCGGRRVKGHPCDRCGKKGGPTRDDYDDRRGSAASRGYGWKWRNENGTGAADAYLQANPLCAECQWHGQVVGAVLVDHKRPHKGNQTLFWDTDNWQSLCKRCHDCKTYREQRAMPKYVICGPPGSGKTTWVRHRAQQGDLVFDADYLMATMFSTPLHAPVEHGMGLVERLRSIVVDWLQHHPDRSAFVIQANEERARDTAYKLGAVLVAIDASHQVKCCDVQ